MRDFIIYKQPKIPNPVVKEKYSVEELKEYPGSSIIKELELAKSGELKFVRDTEYLNKFTFSCNFQLPTPLAAKSVRYTEIVSDLWQQKTGNFAISFNAPKKMSKVAIALLSLATFGDPFLIKTTLLSRVDFLKLNDYILSMGGDLRQLIFWGIKGQDKSEAQIKQFRLSGTKLEKMPGFYELLNNASKIRLLGFGFKPSTESREIRFRLIHWGGGQLYSPPDPLSHEIFEFLNLFDQNLISGRNE